MSLLDEVLPDWDKRERHSKWVRGGPERVFAALESLRIRDLWLTPALLRARGGPAGWFRGLGESGDLLVLDSIAPKRMAEDRPRELLLGDIARYAAVTPSRPDVPRGDVEVFRGFAEDGWTKVGMNFLLLPERDGTRVWTETRVRSTDEATRRTFALYWLGVRLGSGWIRREILNSLGRAAR